MRRRLLLILAAAVVVVLGTGIAAAADAPSAGRHARDERDRRDGGDADDPRPRRRRPRRPKPKPPQTEPVDRRCWTMFGGGPRRTLARPGDRARHPGSEAALGARTEGLHRVPGELLRRGALREHLQGRHVGDRGRDWRRPLAATKRRAEALDSGYRRRPARRRRQGRDCVRPASDRTGSSRGRFERMRSSSRHRPSPTGLRTSVRQTGASSPSTSRPGRSNGHSTRVAASTRVHPSRRVGCASRPMRARSSASVRRTAKSSGART